MCTQQFGSWMIDVCGKFSCPPETLTLAQEYPEPAAFIAQLRGMNMNQEAVEAMARILPPEKSVEWAEVCAQMAGEKAGISTEELQALDAAKAWSLDPTDVNRMDAEFAAGNLPPNTPAMWVANAAAWSEPFEFPADTVPLPFASDLTARAVVGAVRLSAAMIGAGRPIEIPSLSKESLGGAISVQGDSTSGAMWSQANAMTPEQFEMSSKLLDPLVEKGVGLAQGLPNWSCTDPLCAPGIAGSL